MLRRTPEVDTAAGRVRGFAESGVDVFRGIPYGGDTSGVARFRPPAPPTPWAGVREALAYGDRAPQLPPSARALSAYMPRVRPPAPRRRVESEACLVLNVWAPSAPPETPRPVMVWIHGGGYYRGSASSPWTDGAALARHADAVVVSVNHRLGVLGYLHLGDVSGGAYPASGNSGNLDLVAALEWVRDNIAGFGGDPGCVTAFGCSGGGCKISNLLAMPAARGLFHRAIVQSGPAPVVQERDDAAELAERLLHALDLGADDVAMLHELAPGRLLEASRVALGDRPLTERAGVGLPNHGFAPVVDGEALLCHPIDALAAGEAAPVPLMIGSNREDVLAFSWMIEGADGLADDAVRDRLTGALGPHAEEIVTRYRASRPDAGSLELVVAIMTDCMFRVPSTRLALAHVAAGQAPAFVYEFGWASADRSVRPIHTLEVPFIFGNIAELPDAAGDPSGPATAGVVMGLWASFARDGVPMDGTLDWAAYGPADRRSVAIDRDPRVVEDLRGEERAAFDDVPLAWLGSGRMVAPPAATPDPG